MRHKRLPPRRLRALGTPDLGRLDVRLPGLGAGQETASRSISEATRTSSPSRPGSRSRSQGYPRLASSRPLAAAFQPDRWASAALGSKRNELELGSSGVATLARSVRVRTVLDARPGTPRRYLLQTLLLAHSLVAVGGGSPLEVVVIGEAGDSLGARLRELGVELVTSPPHPLDAVGRNTNKLLGLRHPSDGPVLLVDNDLCFLEDVSDLAGRSVRASIGGTARVTDAQWAHIEQATGLRPLAAEWVPMRERLEAAKAGREPQPEQRLYLSAGVVWVGRPPELEAIWSAHIDAIAHAFEGHPASTRQVRGSDQAGFATAVANGRRLRPAPVRVQLSADVLPARTVRAHRRSSTSTSSARTRPWSCRKR